jgi:hypothetical protein
LRVIRIFDIWMRTFHQQTLQSSSLLLCCEVYSEKTGDALVGPGYKVQSTRYFVSSLATIVISTDRWLLILVYHFLAAPPQIESCRWFVDPELSTATSNHRKEGPIFEKAIMRIAEGMYLTEEKQSTVECLLRSVVHNHNGAMSKVDSGSDDEGGQRESNNYALKMEGRIKRQMWPIETGEHFINLDFLPGTSVNSEKLAKDVLLDTRHTTSPRVFEALLFLKVNRML